MIRRIDNPIIFNSTSCSIKKLLSNDKPNNVMAAYRTSTSVMPRAIAIEELKSRCKAFRINKILMGPKGAEITMPRKNPLSKIRKSIY